VGRELPAPSEAQDSQEQLETLVPREQPDPRVPPVHLDCPEAPALLVPVVSSDRLVRLEPLELLDRLDQLETLDCKDQMVQLVHLAHKELLGPWVALEGLDLLDSQGPQGTQVCPAQLGCLDSPVHLVFKVPLEELDHLEPPVDRVQPEHLDWLDHLD
jgi:hypothetical protein